MKKLLQKLTMAAVLAGCSYPGAFAQDTITDVIYNTGLQEFCKPDQTLLSAPPNPGFVVGADANVTVKSHTGITLQPGFSAGNWNPGGRFTGKIDPTCIESVTIDGAFPSHTAEPEINPITGEPFPLAYDRWGNSYNLSDIQHGSCTSQWDTDAELFNVGGMFNLSFCISGNVDPFDQVTINTIRQVFEDLGNLIVPQQCGVTPPAVNIQITAPGIGHAEELPPAVLAAASQFYIPEIEMCRNLSNEPSGIVYGSVWQAINTGEHNTALMDAQIAINFAHHDNPNFPENETIFNTDYTVSTPFDQFDLYTVILHEVIHCLGFASWIGEFGESWIAPYDYYSRFDTYIKGNSLNAIQWDLNNLYAPYYTGASLGECDMTFDGLYCQADIAAWLEGKHSHFSSSCNGTLDRVMEATLDPGEEKRELTDDDVSVLLDLGYQITGIFPPNMAAIPPVPIPSGGPGVIGLDDGTNLYNPDCATLIQTDMCLPDNHVFITEAELIANDINADEIRSLEVVGFGSLLAPAGPGVWEFTPLMTGAHKLRYVPVQLPVDNNNINITTVGNSSCVTIEVFPCELESCYEPDPCNQICNPNFDHPTVTENCDYGAHFQVDPVPSWIATGTPDWRECPGYNPPNPGYAHMFADFGESLWAYGNCESQGEGIITNINTIPGENYTLSYYRRRDDDNTGGHPLEHFFVRLFKSNASPGLPSLVSHCIPDVPAQSQLIIEELDVVSTTWEQVVVCFTADDTYDRIWIYPEMTVGQNVRDILVDRVELVLDEYSAGPDQGTCADATLGIPSCDVDNATYTWTVLGNPTVIGTDQTVIGTPTNTYQVIRSYPPWPSNPINLPITSSSCDLTETVSVYDGLFQVNVVVTLDDHCGECIGSATANISNAAQPVSVSWEDLSSGTIVSTSEDAFNLCGENVYEVTVTDANGCISITQFTMTGEGILEVSVDATMACDGQNTGSIIITPNNGTAPYTYNWVPGVSTSGTATNLAAGTYSVIITEANGCSAEEEITILESPPMSLSVDASESCAIPCNGLANVTITGGTPLYNEVWTDIGGSSISPNNLCPGDYTVTITDDIGCVISETVTVNEFDASSISVATTDVACFGDCDGEAEVSALSFSAAYYWNGSTTSGPSSIDGLCAGSYTVEVVNTDNNCSAIVPFDINAPEQLVPNEIATDITCNGYNDGEATVNPTGGVTPYSFLWSNGQTTQTATNLSASSYIIAVTDANNCTAIAVATINEPDVLYADPLIDHVTCYGYNDGKILFDVFGGTWPYSFIWSPIVNSGQSAVNLSAGTYSVTITDANGCSILEEAEVLDGPQIILELDPAESCENLCNGSVGLNISGAGTAPYTTVWTDGNGSVSPIDMCPGDYTVTVTDANGCEVSEDFTIEEFNAALANVITTGITCFGACDGTASVSTLPFPAEYYWNGSSTPGSSNITGLCIGSSYSVEINNLENNCSIVVPFDIGGGDVLASTVTTTDVTCDGIDDGTASAIITGGVTPYTFLWSNGETTNSIDDLPAGTYSVIVTDANGCTTTASGEVFDYDDLEVNVINIAAVCNGSLGSATVGPVGGLPQYTYLWSDGQTDANAVGLVGGTYTVIITDANSCTATETVSIADYGNFDITIDKTAVNGTSYAPGETVVYEIQVCNQGSHPLNSIEITDIIPSQFDMVVVGDFDWLNGDPGTNTLTATVSDLVVNGCTTLTFSAVLNEDICDEVVVTNCATAIGYVEDCESNTYSSCEDITVTGANISLVTSGEASCFGSCDGSATVTISGGTAPYGVDWQPGGATTETVNGLCPGNYDVTITDANGCSAVASYEVLELDEISANLTTMNISCDGTIGGQITANPTGGSGSYTYLWSNNATSSAITGLAAGVYTVAITDDNNCTVIASAEVFDYDDLEVDVISVVHICDPDPGSITVGAIGGNGPYTYLWSNGEVTPTITNVVAGTHTVTLTDEDGCTATESITIIKAHNVDIKIDKTAISGPSYIPGETVTYEVEVCNTSSVQIDNVTIQDILPNGFSSIGIGDFGWLNNDPNTNTLVRTLTLGPSGSPTGCATFTFFAVIDETCTDITITNCATVTGDIQGCQLATFQSCEDITVKGANISLAVSGEASCYGSCDGSATVTVNGYGTPPYNFEWQPGGATTETANNLCPGNYDVTVTDANGCTATASYEVLELDEIVLSTSSTDAICNGQSNGEATVIPSPGPLTDYTYEWDNGVYTNVNSNLAAGTYTVIVTNIATGCEAIATVVVNEPDLLEIDADGDNVSCYGANDGQVTITIIGGGTGPTYTYTISSGFWGTQTQTQINNPVFVNLAPGFYQATVTDANGCTATDNFFISSPFEITVDMTSSPACNGSTGWATATPHPGQPNDYTYAWSNGVLTANNPGLSAGTYTVVVTNSLGCTATAEVIINDLNTSTGLEITKTALNGAVFNPGEEVIYQIQVCNNTGSDVNNVVIEDVLDPIFDPYVVTTNDFIQVTVGGVSTLTADLGTMYDGDCETLVFSIFLQDDMLQNSCAVEVSNCADVDAGSGLCALPTSQACTTITVTEPQVFDEVINGPIDVTVVTGSTTTITNETWSISGILYINESRTFINCDFVMEPDAIIWIEQGVEFNWTQGSHMYACDTMWLTMLAVDDAVVNINTGSIIEDAWVGALFFPGSQYDIKDAHFNKNRIHVNRWTGTLGSGNSSFGNITSSTFTCHEQYNDVNSPYTDLYVPFDGHRTYAAIMNNQPHGFTVGSNNEGNWIENANFGIHSTSETQFVSSLNNTFKHIVFETGIDPVYDNVTGTAILARDGEDVIVDAQNTFTDATTGVRAYDQTGMVRVNNNNTFEDLQFGIRVEPWGTAIAAPNKQILIDNNTMTPPLEIGVWCLDNPEADIDVTNNNITVEPQDPMAIGAGIWVEELAINLQTFINIADDTVSGDYDGFYRGIFVSHASAATILRNRVTVPWTSWDVSAMGIYATHFTKSEMRDNFIDGGFIYGDWWRTGLRPEAGAENLIQCNTSTDIGAGLVLSGQMEPSWVRQNAMINNRVGLVLNWGTIGNIGDPGQPWAWDNSWQGAQTHAHTESYSSIADIYTIYHRPQNPNPDFTPFNNVWSTDPTLNPPSSAFSTFQVPAGNDLHDSPCPTDAGSPQFLVAGAGKGESLVKMLDQPNVFGHNNPDREWIRKYSVYEALRNNITTSQEHEKLKAFRDSSSQSNMGRLFKATDAYTSKVDLQSGYSDLLSIKPTALPEENWRNVLLIAYARLLAKENNVVLNGEHKGSSISVDDIESILHPATEAKKLYWSEGEIVQLKEIAEQCPYVGGVGVYIARAMLSRNGTSLFEMNDCEKMRPEENTEESTVLEVTENKGTISTLDIYPNPNNGDFTVTGESVERVEIYSSIGKLLNTYTLSNNTVTVSGLTQGVYLVRAYHTNGKSVTERVVVY